MGAYRDCVLRPRALSTERHDTLQGDCRLSPGGGPPGITRTPPASLGGASWIMRAFLSPCDVYPVRDSATHPETCHDSEATTMTLGDHVPHPERTTATATVHARKDSNQGSLHAETRTRIEDRGEKRALWRRAFARHVHRSGTHTVATRVRWTRCRVMGTTSEHCP